MKNAQTKQTAPTPPAAPVPTTPPPAPEAAPQVAPPSDKYPTSLLAQFSRVLYRASDREQDFLEKFVQECNKETYNVMEAAYILGNREFGFGFLNEPDEDPKYAKDLVQLYMMLSDQGWLAWFLRNLCTDARELKINLTPERVLDSLEDRMNDFQNEVDEARKLLANYPEVLQADIQETIRKRPELVA